MNLLGTFIVQIQSNLRTFACTKGLFNLSAEATINVLSARPRVMCAIFTSTCHVRNILLEEQTHSFSLKFGKGSYVSEEAQKSIKKIMEMCIVQHAQTKSVFTIQPSKT